MTRIPTVSELYNSIISDLEGQFSTTIDPNGKAVLRAISAVMAAKLKILYYELGVLQRNEWVDQADPVAAGGNLERFGAVKNLVPFAGTQAQIVCSVIGNSGVTLKSGTTWKSDDNSLHPSKLYVLDSDYTLSGSGDTITLRSLEVGTGATLIVGNTLTCTQPIANANRQVTVASISVNPVDAETTEQFRTRLIKAYRLEPQGGAAADYRLWGLTVAGVANIYPYTVSGTSNTVAVYVEALLADSTDGKGTPTATILTNIANVYDASNGLKPLSVYPVLTNPIEIVEIDITIADTSTLPLATKNLIETALTNYLATVRPFIAGIDNVAETNDTITNGKFSGVVYNTISGIPFGDITFTITEAGGSPVSVSSYLFDFGKIPHLNSVTFA